MSAGARANAPQTWVTWRGIEADKGASAWYLTRFVRSDVKFREVEPGLLDLGDGKPFDVPQAQHRRTHQNAVYEQLQLAYPTDDRSAKRIGEIIHDIEINLWGPKKFAESDRIQKATMDLAESRGDGWIPLNCYVQWFDAIYSRLNRVGNLDSVPDFPDTCLLKK